MRPRPRRSTFRPSFRMTRCSRGLAFLLALLLSLADLPVIVFSTATAQEICARDGDVNLDTRITPADARLAFQAFLGVAATPLTTCQQQHANVVEPGTSAITPADVVCILALFFGETSCLVNMTPVADAGEPQTVDVGTLVTLDGTGSFDPDGDALAFLWSLVTIPDNSDATLSDPGAAQPTFVADQPGTYVLALRVTDGQEESLPDMVQITANQANAPPLLAAIGDRTVMLGNLLSLTLTASDPENAPLTFAAAPLPLPNNAELNATTGLFTFRPTTAGVVNVTFSVSDGFNQATETIAITVQAPPDGTPTALRGRLLDTSDFVQGTETPVVGATVTLLETGITATSDNAGNFLLSGVPAGAQVLDINTTAAQPAPDGSPYAAFREAITLLPGTTNVVDRPFFMPRLAMESLTPVDQNAMTVVTNPTLQVSLSVPPGTAMGDDGAPFTGNLSISLVPGSMAPAALPDELQFGMLITIQPVGVRFTTPVPITFPNIDNLLPGSEVNIWSLDPETGQFVVVGTARVTADGQRVQTVSGGIRAADWHGILPPGVDGAGNNDNNQCMMGQNCCCDRATGSRTAVSTGNLTEEHVLASYLSLNVQRALRLVYNSLHADPQPIITANPTIPVRAAVPPTVSAQLQVAGIDLGRTVVTDTSGLNENRDETFRQAVQFDASAMPTGVYPYALTITSNYANSGIANTLMGTVLVNNQQNSVFGAGWTLSDLRQLHPGNNGSMVLRDGNGTIQVFADPQPDVPGAKTFTSPPGEFSTLARVTNGTFTLTRKDGTQIFFTANGFQTSVVDRNGNTTRFAYDAANRLMSITDPVGLVTTLTYTDGLLATVTDPAERTTTLMHNDTGDLTQITDPDGSQRTFTYDRRHRLVTQSSKRGFLTAYTYNFAGRNVQVTRPDSSTRQIAPSEIAGLVNPTSALGSPTNPAPVIRQEDVIATFTDGNGNGTTYTTNRFGASTDTIDALGRRITTTRDDNGNPVRVVDLDGTISDLTYDTRGNLLTLTEVVGTPLERVTRFAYEPAFNQITSITDPLQQVTTIEYDGRGNPTQVTDALGGQRIMTYNAQGLVMTIVDENAHSTALGYDPQGNLATITDAVGSITRLTRDTAGNLISIAEGADSPDERTSTLTYDPLNRLLTSTDATLAQVSYQYNAAGNLIAFADPTGETIVMDYDPLDRLSRVSDPLRGELQYQYDSNGNVMTILSGASATIRFNYDAVDRLVRTVNALGGEQHFAYDAAGNIVSFTDARGQATTFAYDLLNRQIQQTNALSQSTTLTYDSRSNLLSSTDGDGRVIERTYDALGRLTQVITPDNTITLTYDPAGNVIAAADDDSDTRFRYDGRNRPVIVRTVAGDHQPATTLTYAYNNLGERRRLDDSAGGTTRYAYDAASRLTQIRTPGGDSITQSSDLSGRLRQLVFPNSVTSDYQYDAQGGLASLTHQARDTASPLAAFTYTYDALGNVRSLNEQNSMREAVPRGVVTLQYDENNRLIADDDFMYSYDVNGNLATQIARSDGAVTTYTFNTQNQLSRITFPDASTASYRYDALGRRIEKNVNGTITRYVYDGDNILLEYDDANALVARYSHGDKNDQPLSLERDGQRLFFHADHLGSIRLLTSGNGTVVNSYAYDAYGRSEALLEGVSNPFTYTGRERDAESGLYYYRARYYDSRIGRFLSEDPLAMASGDPNFYAYVLGNPVNLKDPSGEIVPLLVAGLVVGLINAAVEATDQALNPSCGRGFKDVAKAFGIGFLAGFVATGVGALVGLGAEALLAGRGLSLVAQTTIAGTLDGVVAGAVQGTINTGLLNVVRNRPFTEGLGQSVFTNALTGGIFGGVGGSIRGADRLAQAQSNVRIALNRAFAGPRNVASAAQQPLRQSGLTPVNIASSAAIGSNTAELVLSRILGLFQ